MPLAYCGYSYTQQGLLFRTFKFYYCFTLYLSVFYFVRLSSFFLSFFFLSLSVSFFLSFFLSFCVLSVIFISPILKRFFSSPTAVFLCSFGDQTRSLAPLCVRELGSSTHSVGRSPGTSLAD